MFVICLSSLQMNNIFDFSFALVLIDVLVNLHTGSCSLQSVAEVSCFWFFFLSKIKLVQTSVLGIETNVKVNIHTCNFLHISLGYTKNCSNSWNCDAHFNTIVKWFSSYYDQQFSPNSKQLNGSLNILIFKKL